MPEDRQTGWGTPGATSIRVDIHTQRYTASIGESSARRRDGREPGTSALLRSSRAEARMERPLAQSLPGCESFARLPAGTPLRSTAGDDAGASFNDDDLGIGGEVVERLRLPRRPRDAHFFDPRRGPRAKCQCALVRREFPVARGQLTGPDATAGPDANDGADGVAGTGASAQVDREPVPGRGGAVREERQRSVKMADEQVVATVAVP